MIHGRRRSSQSYPLIRCRNVAKSPDRNYTWMYILTGVLALFGIMGLARGDWLNGGYLLGAIGLAVWIYGKRARRPKTVRLGLVVSGAGVAVLLLDMLLEMFS